MDWQAWRPTYEAILADFGWNAHDDRVSAAALQSLLRARPAGWPLVDAILRDQPHAVVVGAGPSLENLDRWPDPWWGLPIVCADGATTWLRRLAVVPSVVVTDLDGPEEDLAWAARGGSVFVVHAHGHNRAALPRIVPRLGRRVAGSCQCNPDGLAPLQNRGGFTDGDRAVLLCEAAGVGQVTLVGFDLDGPPGRLGHRFDPVIKARKLGWARSILAAAEGRGLDVRVAGSGRDEKKGEGG